MEFNEKVRLVADGLKPDGKFTDFEIMQLCRQLRGAKYSLDIAEQKLAAMESQKPVGTLNVQRWRGIDSMINTDFSVADDLPDGTYHCYAKPVPADKPAVAAPDSSELIALLGVMCGWFETLAAKAGWTPQNAGSAFYGYQKAKEAMLEAAPSHSQQSEHVGPEIWHRLKTDPDVFDDVAAGRKTHEIRFNDRCFEVGHGLHLLKTVHSGEEMRAGAPLKYTGDEYNCVVTHVLSGYGLKDGWVILSIAPLSDRCPSHESERGGAV